MSAAPPRHVVQVVRSDGFAGVERYVADVAGELAARGWRVSVIGGDPQRMRAELPDAVQWHPGVTVAEVARSLRRIGPVDVLHAHMTAAELPAALLRRRARLVVTRHFAARRGSSVPARVVGRFIASRVHAQLAISEFVAGAVEGFSTVVPNAVAASVQTDVPREPVVIVVQRFEVEKDTATALRAFAASGLAADGWRLELYGRGAQRAELERLAVDLGIAGATRFVGFVDDPRARMAAASVLLATAPLEPFGLAVVEAMAEGTPVVAADGGAHRETLGEHGAYFAPGDHAAAAVALERLAADESARHEVGAALRERQRARFGLDGHVDQLDAAYRV